MMFLLALTLGCNRYEMFRLGGYQQETFSNRADILFVIDNSPSMGDEATSLAENFDAFIEDLAAGNAEHPQEDLGDAVVDYLAQHSEGGFVDFQLAVTTTNVEGTWGALAGKPSSKVITRQSEDVAGEFKEALLCEAACFQDVGSIPSDPSYSCGDPLEEVSRQYLDCTCGTMEWLGNCGASQEEPIEAVFMAMCRAVENPPTACFDDVVVPDGSNFPALFTQDDVLSNEGLIRDKGTFIPVIISDEGDDSRRQPSQDAVPDVYLDLFRAFDRRMSWVVIGPALDDNYEAECPGPTDWGSIRFDVMTYDTNGLRLDITDPNCEVQDFAAVLNELGALLANLSTVFPLQAVPITDTIRVEVDEKTIHQAEIEGANEYGLDAYSDGWSYRAEDNSVVFHGEAIPSYAAEVHIFYLPLDGIPRELPF